MYRGKHEKEPTAWQKAWAMIKIAFTAYTTVKAVAELIKDIAKLF